MPDTGVDTGVSGDGKDLEMILAREHLLNHVPWPNVLFQGRDELWHCMKVKRMPLSILVPHGQVQSSRFEESTGFPQLSDHAQPLQWVAASYSRLSGHWGMLASVWYIVDIVYPTES